ncbi:hypothetical protein [Desertibacillus haloalkaliphilus]|uniref:hypothetical protein n=1 Tax=Desertibacillus haloalkaliphilus TaxID=1328930 RepID=UPI001C262930|nr:hypothetical protein [Desertibacillus haloalkaliphilus]MBU8906496.1 hypothetical protein [Desertibacillus haloalkaliphilus]
MMTAWLNLTKKELRLGVPAFIIPLVAFVLLVAVAAYFGQRAGYPWEAVAIVALSAIGVQGMYLVYYLLYSLASERKKMHLWLHTPMSGYSLLLAKLVAALISMVITFAITGLTLMVAVSSVENIPIQIRWMEVADIGLLGSIHIFLIAINFAVWFLFFWMIFLLLSRTLSTFLSLIATFFSFIIINVIIYGWFTETAFYRAITMWGPINLDEILFSLSMTSSLDGGTDVATETGPLTVYFGFYFTEALFTLLIFVAACWILDRKVEV